MTKQHVDTPMAPTRRTLARHLISLVVLGIATTAGCRCGKTTQAVAPELLLPGDATAALVVPSLERLGARASGLLGTVREVGTAGGLNRATAQFQAQLGFDPMTADGLRAVGLSPEGALGAALLPARAGALLVLPVSDEDKLVERLTQLGRDRLGATESHTEDVAGQAVLLLTKPGQSSASLAIAIRGPQALVAAGADAKSLMQQALQQAPERSLGKVDRFVRLVERSGQRDLYLLTDATLVPHAGPLTAAVLLGERELSVRLALTPTAEVAARARRLMAGTGTEALQQLPAGAPLYLRAATDPLAALDWLGELPLASPLATALRPLLQGPDGMSIAAPGCAFAVDLSAEATVASLMRRASPETLRALRIEGAGQVAAGVDKARLDRLITASDARDLPISLRRDEAWLHWEGGGAPLTSAQTTSPNDRARVSPEPFAPRVRELLFGSAGVVLAADFKALVRSVGRLPDSAWGNGPAAFMARSAAGGVLRQLAGWQAVVAVVPMGEELVADVALTVVPAAASTPARLETTSP